MTYVYDKVYLDDAMRTLGEAMDYVVNSCNLNMDAFLDLFISGGFADQFESGVPKYVSGMSGIELVCDVLEKAGIKGRFPEAESSYEYSLEYWCGWILAYYQWNTGKSFKRISNGISMVELEKLYYTLHEAPEEKTVYVLDKIIGRNIPHTQLQILRKTAGYSQKTLAEKSGVNLRNIQQYEQRVKDINKASAGALMALARVLGCRMEDLLE